MNSLDRAFACPLAGLGVAGLCILWRQRLVSGWKPLLAGVITIIVTMGLIFFIHDLARATRMEIPSMWWMPLFKLLPGR